MEALVHAKNGHCLAVSFVKPQQSAALLSASTTLHPQWDTTVAIMVTAIAF
jgi:hypothetical protein